MTDTSVAVIGGGVAGLCCARTLSAAGVPFVLLEEAEQVGGRVATDSVDGFLLDRGFQVFLTAYQEPKRFLDYAALVLCSFAKGVLVRRAERFVRFPDPWSQPSRALEALLSAAGSLRDKLLLARLRRNVCRGEAAAIFSRSETSSYFFLRGFGFSEQFIDSFFRPLFGGVFLETGLDTSCCMLQYVLRMFSLGEIALPRAGMGAVVQQLQAKLPGGSVRTGAKVRGIDRGRVILEGGERIKAARIVVATDAWEAQRLKEEFTAPPPLGVTTIYYAAPQPPIPEPVLVIDGERSGLVNHLCVPSLVSPSYAPQGRHLIAATALGAAQLADKALDSAVKSQMLRWFGTAVRDWRLLRICRIGRALPQNAAPSLRFQNQTLSFGDVFLCGDYLGNASLEGAMISGRSAAEAAIKSI